MTDMYRDLTNGGRVQLKGMFAIAGSRYAFYDPSSSTRRSENNAIPPMARTKTIPLVERTFIRAGTLDDASVNPIIAQTTLKRLLDGEPGIVLLESQHRSEERRVGKECVSTCRCGWSPDH